MTKQMKEDSPHASLLMSYHSKTLYNKKIWSVILFSLMGLKFIIFLSGQEIRYTKFKVLQILYQLYYSVA